MSRFLVVVPPFTGHINPVIGVAELLRSRGHEVHWTGDETVLSGLLPRGWRIHDCGPAPLRRRPPELRCFAALKHLWENVLMPLADSMMPGVKRAVDLVRPDVIVSDQQALAGALVAQQTGIAWATSATTSAELADPLATMPQVTAWRTELLNALRQRHGLPADGADPRFSPRLIIAFTTAELAGDLPRPVHFVGPVSRPDHDERFPWDRLDRARLPVLVTMGTANADASRDFLRQCADAVRAMPGVQGIFADPGDALSGMDEGIVRMPWQPQQALLPHMAAVICHAGHNTVCEALACGVPLVLAPIRDDQPVVADQVVGAGAGLRVRFDRAKATHVTRALDRVLSDPAFREAALRIQESFLAAGGAPAAASALARLGQR
jgi:MGT family glycosyltransferase